MIKYILSILAFLYLLGCNHQTNINERIAETTGKGNIKNKKIYYSQKDTIDFDIIEYYENGNIKSKGHMKDTIIIGYWEYFYENGQLMQKGNYVIDDSSNNGQFTYSYKVQLKDDEGNPVKEYDGWMCSLGVMERERKNIHVCKDGFWEFYYENGNLKGKGNFANGWPTDKFEEYFENGKIKLESFFKNHHATNTWKYYYDNGQKKKEVVFTDSSQLLMQAWAYSGASQVVNGNGQFLESEEGGSNKWIFSTYKDGILNGTYIRYFENGKIEEEGQYKNGKFDGKWITYYFYYGPFIEVNYKNGEKHGFFYEFYINGDTLQIRNFFNGKEDGISREYEFKTLTVIEPWIMGKRHGIRKLFDKITGKLYMCDYFFNDDLIAYERYEDGKLIEKSIYKGKEKEFKELTLK